MVLRSRMCRAVAHVGPGVRAPANRPRRARVLKYILRSYSSESAGNQKESKMYIGGGIGLVLLIVILVMFLR
jgi:hypothetical protein